MKGKRGGKVRSASSPHLGDPKTMRAGFAHVMTRDPVLAKHMDARGIIKFEPGGELFESLVESILSQQLAGSAADAIIKRVRAIYPRGALRPKDIHSTHPRKLRAAGVSPQKLAYLKDLSSRIVGGSLDLESLRDKPDEEIIAALDEVKGVGPWTVQMLLIFTLGRPDVLPVDDYGIRRGVQVVYGLPDLPKKAEIERIGERWRPFRTVASLYLWRAKDSVAAAALVAPQ